LSPDSDWRFTVTHNLIGTDTLGRHPQVQALAAALSEPFDPKDVKFKPQSVKNNRCLAMAYIDARLIQDRLDEVLGVENWQDRYDILPDGSVMCRLRVNLGGRWITKADVGSPSEQPDLGDRLKAAFSDALKRAAVKFGIGRYLYRLPAQWVDYDPAKKQMVRPPQLPAFARPASTARVPAVRVRESKGAAEGEGARSAPALPESGAELHRRLQDYDARLAARKLCARGALLAHVAQAGIDVGYSANLAEWTGDAISFAVYTVKAFEKSLNAAAKSTTRSAA
jgi:hypothetical protein